MRRFSSAAMLAAAAATVLRHAPPPAPAFTELDHMGRTRSYYNHRPYMIGVGSPMSLEQLVHRSAQRRRARQTHPSKRGRT